jgi:GH24 family phage-related lysozyme (muramidase)
MTNYIPSPTLIAFIKSKEGCAEWNDELQMFMPYEDSGGISTIGYGHKVTHFDIQVGVFKYGLSQGGCDRLFEQDLAPRVKFINSLDIPSLTQGQVDALIDIAYNVGYGAVKAIQSFGLTNAPATMMHYIHDAHGRELKGLITRRQQDVAWWTGAEEGKIA